MSQAGSWLAGKTTPHYLRSSCIRRIHAPSPPNHACHSPGAVCIIQLFTASVECERKCCGNRHWQLGREQGRQGVIGTLFYIVGSGLLLVLPGTMGLQLELERQDKS